ncbi:DNA alkylation repair protein [Vibrio sp. VB16]|uniref:DNA alkylation repair protein n=1 Tax=Vibrio sp. VB16 TaxID=2785746 RepID=UPI00189F5E51|nr:DNA alkylation repair protein [Vibrio sp. VB16]UGA57309.1 hypothetical protein IUZ65_017565 [Vibrio sp. VB16]
MIEIPNYLDPQIPTASRGIVKGVPLKEQLNEKAIGFMARNIELVYSEFDVQTFAKQAIDGLESLSIMGRAKHIATSLRHTLPSNYSDAMEIIVASMLPPSKPDDTLGIAAFYYLPFSTYIADYGLDPANNDGDDPFDVSIQAQVELTKRFTAEFSIRPFLIEQQERTLNVLTSWLNDPSEDVRRLCSEGSRPKLPWGKNIPNFIQDPSPIIPILESLKNDSSLYVQRSVANSLGDIAKDHPDLVFKLCDEWLSSADKELKWVIRHAVRYYAKKEHPKALDLRVKAKV